jgi:hypothetical protein
MEGCTGLINEEQRAVRALGAFFGACSRVNTSFGRFFGSDINGEGGFLAASHSDPSCSSGGA